MHSSRFNVTPIKVIKPLEKFYSQSAALIHNPVEQQPHVRYRPRSTKALRAKKWRRRAMQGRGKSSGKPRRVFLQYRMILLSTNALSSSLYTISCSMPHPIRDLAPCYCYVNGWTAQPLMRSAQDCIFKTVLHARSLSNISYLLDSHLPVFKFLDYL